MGSYRLLKKRGNHVEHGADGKPITYKPGDIVKSDVDLVKQFPNKFVQVGERIEDGSVEQPDIPVPPGTTETSKVPEAKGG